MMQHHRFSELTLGQEASFEVTVSESMLDGFVSLTGDVSPIHMSDEHARQRNHARRVVHGLFSSAFFSTLVGVHLPGSRALLQGVNFTFHAPVYVGDTLTITGVITHLNEAYKVMELRGRITNQAGEVVVKAKLSVGVHE